MVQKPKIKGNIEEKGFIMRSRIRKEMSIIAWAIALLSYSCGCGGAGGRDTTVPSIEVIEPEEGAAVGGTVRLEDVLDHVPVEPVTTGQAGTRSLREARLSFERHYIALVLNRHRGRMKDAARSLGMQRTNLYRKVRQLGIGLVRGQGQQK